MSKADLKAAMDLLQVKKPLKLSSRPPQFKVPEPIPETTLVATETQVAQTTQVPMQTMVPTQTQVVPQTRVATPTSALVPAPTPTEIPEITPQNFEEFMTIAEREYLRNGLDLMNGRALEFAQKIGVGKGTIYEKMAQLGIPRRSYGQHSEAVSEENNAMSLGD